MTSSQAEVTTTLGREPFFLEKWYLDTILDDGTLLIVLLGHLRALGLRRARLSAELHLPDGRVVRGDASVGAIVPEGGGRRFHHGQLGETELVWRTSTLSGELRLISRHTSARLRDPLLTDGKRQLRWIVEVPDADVEGELRWSAGRLAVAGRGYRDYLAVDLLPWRLPIRELRWGRAFAGDHACCWMRLGTHDAALEGTWADGHMESRMAPPPLHEERVIQQAHVADIAALRIGALRSVLRRLAGDPYQTRWLAQASLGGARGWAVHELVRWR
ncbi:MAG: hypothetical protein GTN62_06505 [Gemmatimonadales bacterium]|nr:hypothetical protein [Gemmatimonadales bacterium]NIN11148.1 hypothetical protein [Gemmatimonadales bacterium]NIN49747.1 hypothetical protein [Gemmatimonadales bacterium]NIP07211.1 hypothetical protein [Gemmatimonadales bacterium]NIR00424.1 hypothetical protein [Gemmatimonadales bacterium]